MDDLVRKRLGSNVLGFNTELTAGIAARAAEILLAGIK